MKTIEEASLENSKNHYMMAFSDELHFDADMDFKAGAEWMNQQWQEKLRWIPVDEKLPEREDVQYDVKVYDGERRLAWFNNGGQRWSLFGYSDTVTHWREIIE